MAIDISWGSFIAGVALGGATAVVVFYSAGRAPVEIDNATPAEVADEPEQGVKITFIDVLQDDKVTTGNEQAPVVDQGPQEYIVQTASYERLQDAEMLLAQLMLDGMSVRIASSPRETGGALHRVLVGPFENQGEAQQARDELRERDIPAAILSRPLPPESPAQPLP